MAGTPAYRVSGNCRTTVADGPTAGDCVALKEAPKAVVAGVNTARSGVAEPPGVQLKDAEDERDVDPGASFAVATVAPKEFTRVTVPLGAMEPARDVTVAVYVVAWFAVTTLGARRDVDVGTDPTARFDVVPAAVTDQVPGIEGVQGRVAFP